MPEKISRIAGEQLWSVSLLSIRLTPEIGIFFYCLVFSLEIQKLIVFDVATRLSGIGPNRIPFMAITRLDQCFSTWVPTNLCKVRLAEVF